MKEDKNIQDFLDSGILEQYVIGTTSQTENIVVEQKLAQSAELRFAYEKLQEELQAFSKLYQKAPPQELKEQILSKLPEAAPSQVQNSSGSLWFNVAAIFIGLIGIAGFIYTGLQKEDLENQLSEGRSQIEQLQNNLDQAENKNSILNEELAFVKNEATTKYILRGNNKAESLLATAYYSKKEEKAIFEIAQMPDLDKEHDYQLWADVDGEMISLAVLDNQEEKILDTTVLNNATSLNITIEPKGGNDHATVENLVAAVSINSLP